MRGLVALLLALAGVCAAVPVPRPAGPLPGAELYRRTRAATAWVLAAGQGKGTGWVVDHERRWLVTCYHVVGENETCHVVFPWVRGKTVVGPRHQYLEHMPELERRGIAVRGTVLRRSKDSDLALVELAALPAGVPALRLAEHAAGPGQRVLLVGNRYDAAVLWTASTGRVRAVRTLAQGYFSSGRQLAKGVRVLLTSVPINEGDSGGPLVNERGEVVGVAAAVAWEAHGGGLFIDRGAVRALLPGAPTPEGAGVAAAVYARAARSVALVQYDGGGRFAGVLMDCGRRLVLTTAEAVAREKTVTVTFAVAPNEVLVTEAAWYRTQGELLRHKGARATGVVLAVDRRRNLALVEADRVPNGAAAAVLARQAAAPGDTLHVVSHPAGLEVLWVYAPASVRQRDHANLGQTREGPDPEVLLVQAPLSESEGGGPVLDERGELVGIVSGKISPQQQIAYVLDVGEVRAFLAEARPWAAPRTPAERLARAERFVAARQYEWAVAEYTAVPTAGGRQAEALAGRAWVHSLQGQYDRAAADAERALAVDGRQVQARCARAAAWLGQGKSARAVTECDRAIKDDPRSPLAYALRARANLRLGQIERARDDAGEAVWLGPRLALAYLARGQVHARRGEAVKAVEDFGRAVALEPHLAEAYRRRGDAAWAHSDSAAALADYTQALKWAPRDALALAGRGRARLVRGVSDAGLADLDAALKLRPDLAEVYVERGGEKVRRAWTRTGPADLVEAVRRKPALLPAVLAELERRAADLTPADEAAVYNRVLEGVVGSVGQELRKFVVAGLVEARAEKDVARQARALRQLVATLRSKLGER
jgi:S1-C subfamily serine protease/tetratricopeptide (TPR) repeat protein